MKADAQQIIPKNQKWWPEQKGDQARVGWFMNTLLYIFGL